MKQPEKKFPCKNETDISFTEAQTADQDQVSVNNEKSQLLAPKSLALNSNLNKIPSKYHQHQRPMILLQPSQLSSTLSTPEYTVLPELSTPQSTIYIHVDAGHVFQFQLGNETREIIGPATVRMVSNDGVQPVPIQLITPSPGQLIQQVVDENGVLTHLVLSSQKQTDDCGSKISDVYDNGLNMMMPPQSNTMINISESIHPAKIEVNIQKSFLFQFVLNTVQNYSITVNFLFKITKAIRNLR